MINDIYKYHHVGMPTEVIKTNEEYNEDWKFYASGYFDSEYGVEWLRIKKESKLHPLIKTLPHVAFVVKDIDLATLGYTIIHGPIYPEKGVKVCFIEHECAPIEFLQFDKPEREVWPNHKKIVSPIVSIESKEGSTNFSYHHLGICTNVKRKGFIYSKDYKLHYTDYKNNPFKVQWIKYDSECKLPPLIQNTSYIAFRVNNLERALKDKKVIVKPHRTSNGISIAFIEENGAPIKFLQIDKTQ